MDLAKHIAQTISGHFHPDKFEDHTKRCFRKLICQEASSRANRGSGSSSSGEGHQFDGCAETKLCSGGRRQNPRVPSQKKRTRKPTRSAKAIRKAGQTSPENGDKGGDAPVPGLQSPITGVPVGRAGGWFLVRCARIDHFSVRSSSAPPRENTNLADSEVTLSWRRRGYLRAREWDGNEQSLCGADQDSAAREVVHG
jgi:hypothetical protein